MLTSVSGIFCCGGRGHMLSIKNTCRKRKEAPIIAPGLSYPVLTKPSWEEIDRVGGLSKLHKYTHNL